jgi:hypothetical protein
LLARINHSLAKLYKLELKIAQSVCLAACAGSDAWLWHTRFGHISFGSLRKMSSKGHVRGLPIIDQVDELCDACLAGKQRRAPFPQLVTQRATRPLELLHGDLCGPINPATPRGNRYFLLLVDDYNRYMWVCLLPSKDHAVTEIKRIKAAVERKSGYTLGALRTDRGGEFTANDSKIIVLSLE